MDHEPSRAAFQAGCRCLPCRVANAAYQRDYVPADWTTATASRAHLQALMAQGIGIRRASDLSGLSLAHLQRIRNGQQRTVKRTTEQTVLAIPAQPALGQRINSYRTRHLLRSLRAEGFTLAALAAKLGLRSPTLRLHRQGRITVRNARKVRALWQSEMAE